MRHIPKAAAAVLAALHRSEPRLDSLQGLDDAGWRAALEFCERSQLILALREAARDVMPDWVRERTDSDFAKNAIRLRQLEALYRDLAERLDGAGVEFLALKGLTQVPAFGTSAENRTQYDIDLYCPREQVMLAQEALLPSGLEPIEGMDEFPTDHLPALIRKTGWQWRGDFFDTEIPLAVELHFRFWNGELEHLPAPGVEEFWERRVVREIAGVPMACLSPVDAPAYSALHFLKHVLRGSAKPFHAFELARFLELHEDDAEFWREWRGTHGVELQRLQAVAFRIAAAWFGGSELEFDPLPAAAEAWFDEHALSPLTRAFHPNKDELWLHLSLIEGWRGKAQVMRRRMLPGRLPGAVDAVHVPEEQMTPWMRIRKRVRYAAYVAERVRHHALAVAPTLASGARLWFGGSFWNFLAAGALFNFGLFIFVLLYNLHLLDLGFKEDFIGTVNGASTIGTVIGMLPAAWLARRFGLRNVLIGGLAAFAMLIPARAVVVASAPLIGLAFVWGLAFAAWAVVFPPMIAGAVPERRRAAAYSLFFGAMIGIGVTGDWVAGQLPRMVGGKQTAILLSALLPAAAIIPAWRLRGGAAAPEKKSKVYPRSRFVAAYLGMFALWSIATASFNPFANAFFARRHFPVERIGTVFSMSQLVQVIGILLAPIVFRKAGLAVGVMAMMAATAVALAALATQPAGAVLAGAYVFYMMAQWMSEPGLTTLLMNGVAPAEREAATALNYVVGFGAQAAASFGAGQLLTRFGYGPVLGSAACAALCAGAMLTVLRTFPTAPSSAGGSGRG